MRDTIAVNHTRNTLKLSSLDEFNINPFTLPYLSYYFKGNADYKNLAKVLLYPRILGTSISTSFGTNIQKFITNVLGGFGSAIPGIDIEFTSKIDNQKKYSQIKSGPNALNNDDITTVDNHFQSLKNISRINNLKVNVNDLIFCLIYGEPYEKNSFIKKLEKKYTVFIGKEFWYHLTGDSEFYSELIQVLAEVAIEVNMKQEIIKIIDKLAVELEKKYSTSFNKLKT